MENRRDLDKETVSPRKRIKQPEILNRTSEKFHLKKLSSDDIKNLLEESSRDSTSSCSDGENTNGCWAVSKSPVKRDIVAKSSANSNDKEKRFSNSKDFNGLFVSPVKLKRKLELNKETNICVESPKKKDLSIDALQTKNLEKEIFTQIENSPTLNDRKVSLKNNISESKSYCSSATLRNIKNSPLPLKENISIKDCGSDSESNLLLCRKDEELSNKAITKRLEIVVDRINIKNINGTYAEETQESKSNKAISDIESDDITSSVASFGSDITKPSKSIETERKSSRLKSNTTSKDRHEKNSNARKLRNTCRKFKKSYYEDTTESDGSSSCSSSDEIASSKKFPLKNSKVENKKKDNTPERRKNLDNVVESSPISSAGKMGLRNRSKIKQSLFDDFELGDIKSKRNRVENTSPSFKTPQKRVTSKDSNIQYSPKNSSASPRISKRIQEKKGSGKKESVKKDEQTKEVSYTPRSSKRLSNMSPLVDSVERISLRNRSEIIKRGEECDKSELTRHLAAAQSPRTPSQSLRKQVLEVTATRSAKKKLIMGSDSSDSDEDFLPLRRTPRKRVCNLLSKNSEESPVKEKKTPIKSTPNKTPKKGTPTRTPSKRSGEPLTPCTPRTVRRVGQGFLTPVLEERSTRCAPTSSIEEVRLRLHVSTVPSSLPCRLSEFKNIQTFISCKLKDKTGGCMYISGVPGTGKTATVHAVIKTLQQEAIDKKISPFDFVEVNGLRLTDARQAYTRIWESLSGKKVSADQALSHLDKKFSGKPSRPTVLLIDELDYVCNRRQDVVYNVFDWCTRKNSLLVVLTIANTMDLPERTLKGRVTSRMGLTRLGFQPYSYQQLQEIVMDRIKGSNSFDPDAVQFVARKVAAVSGDARRALDICRRTIESLEVNEKQVSLEHVDKTLSQIFLSRRVQAIKHCSYMAQLLLRSIRDETLRTGVEETNVRDVYSHLCSICNLEGSWQPTTGQVLSLCRTLTMSGLLSMEKGRRDILTKITLNVSSDDIHYALSC